MSRYGGWTSSQDGESPFESQRDSRGVPYVTDADFSYITSEDLESSLQSPARTYDPKSRQPPSGSAAGDDILLVKSKGVTYPLHFPAYYIGEGHLRVHDVRDRMGMVLELSTRRTRRVKILYKGRHLKDLEAPLRDYGVKNNSELLMILSEGSLSGDSGSSSSEEELAGTDPMAEQRPKKSKKSKKRKSKKGRRSPRSPRESASTVDLPLNVPRDADSRSPPTAPDAYRHPSRVSSPAMEKLDSINLYFNTELLPQCNDFSAHPPPDDKRCKDEYTRLSEMVMQQVLLRLDEVDTGGDPGVRARRKEIVDQVHDVLKLIDHHQPEGSSRR